MKPAPRPTKKEMVTAFRTREILSAARQVLEQRGLEAMTMEEIAGAAGLAKGTLYLYFQSKNDLIEALISQVGENILVDLEAILAEPGTPADKVRGVAALLLDYLTREQVLFPIYARNLLKKGQGAGKGFWRRLQEREEKFVTLITRLFAQGIEDGQFIAADPRLLTFLFRGLIRGIGYYQLAEGPKMTVKEALPVLLTLLSSGLARQPGALPEVAPR